MFSTFTDLHPRLKKQLKQSWAQLFYTHVFCQIDESCFAPLYCPDNGRPNFPVNILVALEIIKHYFDYTDEELLNEFSFNYQINYALGIYTLGKLPLAARTLYEFRERLFKYTLQHPGEADLNFRTIRSAAYPFPQRNQHQHQRTAHGLHLCRPQHQAGRQTVPGL